MQVDNYYSLINSLRDNFGNLIVPEWRDFSLVELPDYGDIDTVEGMRRYIRKHKESPYSKTGGQGLAPYTPVPQPKNRVIKNIFFARNPYLFIWKASLSLFKRSRKYHRYKTSFYKCYKR